MALIRTNGGAGASALTYTVQEITGGVPVGGKTIDLSSYGDIAMVAFCNGDPETSQTTPVSFNSYVLSSDGGATSDIIVNSNATVGIGSFSNKSITVANSYQALTGMYLVILHN